MSRLIRFGLVLGGYVIACLVASGIVYVYEHITEGSAAQASAGMYAFGDLILFVVLFGVLALFPTGLAIFYLFRKFLVR